MHQQQQQWNQIVCFLSLSLSVHTAALCSVSWHLSYIDGNHCTVLYCMAICCDALKTVQGGGSTRVAGDIACPPCGCRNPLHLILHKVIPLETKLLILRPEVYNYPIIEAVTAPANYTLSASHLGHIGSF